MLSAEWVNVRRCEEGVTFVLDLCRQETTLMEWKQTASNVGTVGNKGR